jgi:hypothetical protein
MSNYTKPSLGLIAFWTGQLDANMEHIRNMAIHQMDDARLEQFEKYVRQASHSIKAIEKHIKDVQEAA